MRGRCRELVGFEVNRDEHHESLSTKWISFYREKFVGYNNILYTLYNI